MIPESHTKSYISSSQLYCPQPPTHLGDMTHGVLGKKRRGEGLYQNFKEDEAHGLKEPPVLIHGP